MSEKSLGLSQIPECYQEFARAALREYADSHFLIYDNVDEILLTQDVIPALNFFANEAIDDSDYEHLRRYQFADASAKEYKYSLHGYLDFADWIRRRGFDVPPTRRGEGSSEDITLSIHGTPGKKDSQPLPEEPVVAEEKSLTDSLGELMADLWQDSGDMIRARLRLIDALKTENGGEIEAAHENYEDVLNRFLDDLTVFENEFDTYGDFLDEDVRTTFQSQYDLEESRYGGELTYFYDDVTDEYEAFLESAPLEDLPDNDDVEEQIDLEDTEVMEEILEEKLVVLTDKTENDNDTGW